LRLDPAALARQRRLNRLHSALLLLSLAGLAGWTGSLVAGTEGLVLGAGLALAFLALDPMPGDLLFRHAFGAVRLSPARAPDLSALLAALARRAGMPHPRRFSTSSRRRCCRPWRPAVGRHPPSR